MIADLDRTLENMLTAELAIQNDEIDIKFEQPTREWSARLSRPTISLFLYDMRENNVLRQHQWERVMQQQGRATGNSVSQKRTPFRVDCHYMLTAWAPEIQDEHMMLSHAMLALFRHPILPDKYMAGDLKDQPFKLVAKLASHDKLTNPAELWGAMDNVMRPSISYIITLAMDPWTMITGPSVRSFTLTEGQTEMLPKKAVLMEKTAVSQTTIGGTVRKGDDPQPDLQVAIKGTGCFGTTDKNGRYILANTPLGKQTLIIWTDGNKPIEKPITIPGDDYDIELEVASGK